MRGEVWWYEPPDSERRPYVILTRNEAIPKLNSVIAAPTTGRIRGIPTEIYLDRSDGMSEECAISLDNVAQIHTVFCTHRITTLSPAQMNAVCLTLGRAIACP